MTLRKNCLSALVAASLLTSPQPASAQGLGDVVDLLTGILDNAEGILTAAQQIVESGVFADLLPLTDEIQQVQTILDQAQNLSFNLSNVVNEFQEIFPEDFADLDLAQTVLSINEVNTSAREAIENALEIQAETVQSQLPSTLRVQAVRTVGAVGGPAAALQAIVQLQAEQFSQFNRLQTLVAAQSRLLSLERAETSNAQARARRLRELDDPTVFATDPPVGVTFGLDALN